MTEEDLPKEGISGFQETEVIEYQAISAMAVGGLLLGLLAAGAMLWPLLWIVPPLGIVVSLVALWRIEHQPTVLTGKMFALVGLALSVFFVALVPTNKIIYDRAIRQEARHFASIWFDALRNGQVVEAYQLTLDPRVRRPLNQLEAAVREPESDPRKGLKEYVAEQDVRTLLALGDKAQVRYYATEFQSSEPGHESLVVVYAVTYDDKGEKKTFFIRLGLERRDLPVGHESDWRVVSSRGGYRPIALGGNGES